MGTINKSSRPGVWYITNYLCEVELDLANEMKMKDLKLKF